MTVAFPDILVPPSAVEPTVLRRARAARFAMIRSLCVRLTPFVLSAFASAQNVTVPASLAGVEGGSGSQTPFGSSLACRYQCIYDVGELPWTGPRVLSGIRIRPDFNAGAASPAKGFLDISVLMSTTSRTAATASAVFAENYGSDATWVVQNRIVQLPAQPAATTAPRPANVEFVFDQVWAYGLTPATASQPAPTSLLVEILIHSQPNGLYRVDNLGSCVASTASFGLVGPACSVPGNAPIELTGDATMLAGSSYTWRIANALPSMPFMVGIDVTNQGGLFGNPAWPLPYPMFDPQDPTQPSAALAALLWPAPDCYLNVTPAASIGGITDAAGAGQASAPLPVGTQFVGSTFYAQAIVLSPTSNPLRFITSLGRETTICGPLGVARVHTFYNGAVSPPPPLPTSGAVQQGVGLVLEVL